MSKKSLTINATRNGKKVSKSLGFINPDVANSLVGGFAQMVNALSNDTFVNAEVVKKMDTTEEDTGGGSTPAGLLDPNLRITNATITWDGDGVCYTGNKSSTFTWNDPIEKGSHATEGFFLLESDGTYAKDWVIIPI